MDVAVENRPVRYGSKRYDWRREMNDSFEEMLTYGQIKESLLEELGEVTREEKKVTGCLLGASEILPKAEDAVIRLVSAVDKIGGDSRVIKTPAQIESAPEHPYYAGLALTKEDKEADPTYFDKLKARAAVAAARYNPGVSVGERMVNARVMGLFGEMDRMPQSVAEVDLWEFLKVDPKRRSMEDLRDVALATIKYADLGVDLNDTMWVVYKYRTEQMKNGLTQGEVAERLERLTRLAVLEKRLDEVGEAYTTLGSGHGNWLEILAYNLWQIDVMTGLGPEHTDTPVSDILAIVGRNIFSGKGDSKA